MKAHLEPPAPPEPNVILEMTMAEARVLYLLARGGASASADDIAVRKAIFGALEPVIG